MPIICVGVVLVFISFAWKLAMLFFAGQVSPTILIIPGLGPLPKKFSEMWTTD